MDSNARRLCELGDKLFSKKAMLDELHQTLAEHFFPERANFTVERVDGEEFAREIYESGPAQARRDLAGAIGAILRPRGKEWFRPVPQDDWRKTDRAMKWADFARDKMRSLLYNDRTNFQKVMTDADDDFVAFGNAVPILTEAPDRNGFLFELSHLRDNAWDVNRYGMVDCNHRKFKWSLRRIAQKYGEKVLSESQKKRLENNPYELVEIRHVLMPLEDYEPIKYPRRAFVGKPYASVYVNYEAMTILDEGGYWEFPMLHRRWRVPSDSVYGYSPAAMLGLVDARVLQSQSRVIMDAGELAVAPPLIAKRDAVLGGVNNYAGAVTWLDIEYDERLGDAIRAIDNRSDVRIGLEMKVDTRNILQAAWYLNKLSLPSDKDMTAYETSERIAEYIRSAGPIFEPFEADNARMLNTLFNMMLRIGYFGPVETIPPELRGGEIVFEFDTPVSQAYQRVKVQRAQEVLQAIGPAAQIDPTVVDNLDLNRLVRDTVTNIGADSAWLTPEDAVANLRAGRQQKLDEQEQMMKAGAALDAAKKAGDATHKFAGAAQGLPQLMQAMQAMQAQNGSGAPAENPLDGFPQIDLGQGQDLGADSGRAGLIPV